jgi:hypothetical protein
LIHHSKYSAKDGENLASKNEKQLNLYIEPEIQQMAREQAKSIGLGENGLSAYTSMLYKLNLAELVRKAVEKEKKKVRKEVEN